MQHCIEFDHGNKFMLLLCYTGMLLWGSMFDTAKIECSFEMVK